MASTPYCGTAPLPDGWLARWNFDPLLLVVLAVCGVALYRLSGREPGRRIYLAASMALLAILFVSPLCALTSALFTGRVVHHVLLTAVVAPLLVLSLPRDRVPAVGPLSGWTAAQAIVLWAWHAPALYSAALSSHATYWMMELSLLGSALAFWAALRRSSPQSAVGALLVTMVQMGLLGALITFARAPLYAPHFASTAPWGLAPLEDQQLAGLIMWAPSAALYLAAALVVAGRFLRTEGRAAA